MFKSPDSTNVHEDTDMKDVIFTSQVSANPTSIEVVPPAPPKTAAAFVDYVNKKAPHIRTLLLRCTVDSNGHFIKLPLADHEKVELSNYFKALATAPQLSAVQHKDINSKNTLLFIMGRLAMSRVSVPREAEEAAEIAFKRFEAQRWGEHRNEVGPSNASTSVVHRTHQSGHKPQPSVSNQIKRRKSSQVDHGQVGSSFVRSSPKHPIYGTNGIMRGIVAKRGATTSFSLDPEASKTNFRMTGHNGLQVGQWWPRKICALRDGAHGSVCGGISSSKTEGIWSVVINSNYKETDHDTGNIVWYSMPQSNVNDNPDVYDAKPEVERMRLSWIRNKPIRVIRGSGAGWDGAPCIGFRYDGLYGIADEQIRTNRKGGLYVRFKFERLPGQVDIDTVRSRPTSGEINDEARVIEGYY